MQRTASQSKPFCACSLCEQARAVKLHLRSMKSTETASTFQCEIFPRFPCLLCNLLPYFVPCPVNTCSAGRGVSSERKPSARVLDASLNGFCQNSAVHVGLGLKTSASVLSSAHGQ